MANSWFRMYAEFANDPKVQMLSEVMQRRLVMLFCLRCGDVTVTLSDEELAFHLRISSEELAETKALFVKKKFIKSDWSIVNWEKRQFASDSSAARTRAYRERMRDASVTSQVTEGDALDTDTDTDTDKSKIKSLVASKPRPTKKPPSDFSITPDMRTWATEKVPGLNIDAETEAFVDHTFATAKTDWEATWRNWMRRSCRDGPKQSTRDKSPADRAMRLFRESQIQQPTLPELGHDRPEVR